MIDQREWEAGLDIPGPDDQQYMNALVADLEKTVGSVVFLRNGESRVKRGLQLLQRGTLGYYGTAAGMTTYDINNYYLTIDTLGKSACSCTDPLMVPGVGKCCSHYFAYRLHHRWVTDVKPVWRAICRRMQGQAEVRLIAEYMYDRKLITVRGVAAAGDSYNLNPKHFFTLTLGQFAKGVRLHGWGLAGLPIKRAGYNYEYPLRPGRGIDIREGTFLHNGVTDVMIDRFKDKMHMLAEYAVEPELLFGVIPVHLAEWEAKMVHKMMLDLDKGVSPNIVFRSLPVPVRDSLMARWDGLHTGEADAGDE